MYRSRYMHSASIYPYIYAHTQNKKTVASGNFTKENMLIACMYACM